MTKQILLDSKGLEPQKSDLISGINPHDFSQNLNNDTIELSIKQLKNEVLRELENNG